MILKLESLLLPVLSLYVAASANMGDNSTNEFSEYENSRVLSRRRRYLTFPEGSTLQLVFCLQTSAIITISDIFLYANTAALAWNLPEDPLYKEFFIDKEKAQSREDVKNIKNNNERGSFFSRVPYKRRLIINPTLAKRSVDEPQSFKEKLNIKIERKKMHEKQLTRHYLKKGHLEENKIEFHRSNRLELLQRIETLLTALGRDGRQCVLYKLCETAQHAPVQGTFLEEFLRVVFTLPKGNEFENIEDQEYDAAHTVVEDCSVLYPGCEHFDISV